MLWHSLRHNDRTFDRRVIARLATMKTPRREGYPIVILGGVAMGVLLKALSIIGRPGWSEWWELMR